MSFEATVGKTWNCCWYCNLEAAKLKYTAIKKPGALATSNQMFLLCCCIVVIVGEEKQSENACFVVRQRNSIIFSNTTPSNTIKQQPHHYNPRTCVKTLYKTHPKQLPIKKAHGRGFKSFKEPRRSALLTSQ